MKSILIQEKEFQKARKKIRENPGKIIIFSSDNDELNRKILEKEKISVLLLNLASRKDRMKQRESGFNSVLAKLAKKNNVALGINLDEIINSEQKEKAKILGRVRQNIKICNKNKLNMKFFSSEKKDKYDLKALGLVLGMPTQMTKNL